MDCLIQLISPHWNTIATNIIGTILLGLGVYFRKAVGAALQYIWRYFRRTYRKARRFKLCQCFPSHTLEYIRLKRQLRKLEFYEQKEKEQNEELEENVIILLTWTSKFRYFRKDDALKAMRWNRPYTHMIFGLAINREHIKLIDNQHALFAITTEGRELLYRRGILRALD